MRGENLFSPAMIGPLSAIAVAGGAPLAPAASTFAFSCRWRKISLNSAEVRCSSVGVSSSSSSSSSVASTVTCSDEEERRLVDGLLGIQGRGRMVSPQKLKEVEKAIATLESAGGVSDPTRSSEIEGQWRLIFTTRPGTASAIQRTFVGVDAFSVFQVIQLHNTGDPRVTNIVRLSDAFGELKVEAAASIENGKRIAFQFDRAAFSFKFFPFKVPYPVPFRLLGDKAKGWLDTTYLSPTGNLRISRGNKGTTFVLQKKIDPRQKLLVAISTGKRVEEALEELAAETKNNALVDLKSLAGKWRLLWSSQPKNENLFNQVLSDLQSFQIEATGSLQNAIDLAPGIQIKSNGSILKASNQLCEVSLNEVALKIGPLMLPSKQKSKIQFCILYLDNKICIRQRDKNGISVHLREEEYL